MPKPLDSSTRAPAHGRSPYARPATTRDARAASLPAPASALEPGFYVNGGLQLDYRLDGSSKLQHFGNDLPPLTQGAAKVLAFLIAQRNASSVSVPVPIGEVLDATGLKRPEFHVVVSQLQQLIGEPAIYIFEGRRSFLDVGAIPLSGSGVNPFAPLAWPDDASLAGLPEQSPLAGDGTGEAGANDAAMYQARWPGGFASIPDTSPGKWPEPVDMTVAGVHLRMKVLSTYVAGVQVNNGPQMNLSKAVVDTLAVLLDRPLGQFVSHAELAGIRKVSAAAIDRHVQALTGVLGGLVFATRGGCRLGPAALPQANASHPG